jgi:hypothetical protein
MTVCPQVFNAVLSCLRSMSRDRTSAVNFLPPESSTWSAEKKLQPIAF